jgi:hypothetical protein
VSTRPWLTAQACRAVSEGKYCDFVDASLIDCRRVRTNATALARPGALPFVDARPSDRAGSRSFRADRVDCLNWAESAPTGAVSGTTAVRAEADLRQP